MTWHRFRHIHSSEGGRSACGCKRAPEGRREARTRQRGPSDRERAARWGIQRGPIERSSLEENGTTEAPAAASERRRDVVRPEHVSRGRTTASAQRDGESRGAPSSEAEDWRRRPDLNRRWRFCRQGRNRQVVESSCLLVGPDPLFYPVCGRFCSQVVPTSPDGEGEGHVVVGDDGHLIDVIAVHDIERLTDRHAWMWRVSAPAPDASL